MIRTAVYFLESGEFGGNEQALLQLLGGLDRRRWRPVLFHPPEDGLAPLLAKARELDVELAVVPPLWGGQAVPRVLRLIRALRAERPAVFHAHLHRALACTRALAAAALARIPAVIATAGLFVEPTPDRLTPVRQRLLATAVDRYIAVSRDVAARLRRSFRIPLAKIRVVHNGIDPARFRQAPVLALEGGSGAPTPALEGGSGGATARPVVLTAARLISQKGHIHLLEAAARIPEALFQLAGDGPERASLEAKARELGVNDRVRFLGYREDVPALLASCDLFVLPSLYEGLPLAMLEAMAAGKPVIASAIGGIDEAVVHDETGILVPPADPAALAGAIRQVLFNPPLARRLGAAGRARVERDFSAESMVQGVVRVYDEVLGAPAVADAGAD